MNMELYESTWVAMSVRLSLIIGFVAFIVMTKKEKKEDEE